MTKSIRLLRFWKAKGMILYENHAQYIDMYLRSDEISFAIFEKNIFKDQKFLTFQAQQSPCNSLLLLLLLLL